VLTQPEGPHLTPEQAHEFNDSYFGSRPYEYFSARIDSLLGSVDRSRSQSTQGLRAKFAAAIGVTDLYDVLRFSDAERELQVVTDSFAVRHHAAEALVRLYHGLTASSRPESAPRCVWASVADGPTRTVDLVGQARAHLTSADGRRTFWSLVLPPSIADQPTREAETALNVMGAWLKYAMHLLVRSDIDINAAHNKVKHGLAIRSRNDLRLTFTTQAPNADGTVPLSALTGPAAFDVLDTTTLDYLARPPKDENGKQGIELCSLRLAPETLLVEAWMMAVTLGAMFHVAAADHYGDRDVEFAPYPRLPLAPSPEQLLGGTVVGLRHPVTTRPGGGAPREPGIAYHNAFQPITIDITGSFSTTVVHG
jgi:hypothetical protein